MIKLRALHATLWQKILNSGTFLCHYRSQRSWGKVIFSEACVNNSVHWRGRRVWRRACMAGGMRGGGHAWQMGMHGRGACMAGGVHGGGGACMVVGGRGVCVGGHVWGVCMAHMPPRQTLRDTVNERAVRILLECNLFNNCHLGISSIAVVAIFERKKSFVTIFMLSQMIIIYYKY